MSYQRGMSLHEARTRLKQWHKGRELDYGQWQQLHGWLWSRDDLKQEAARSQVECMQAGQRLLKFLRENYTLNRADALSGVELRVIEEWDFTDVTDPIHLNRLEGIKEKLLEYYRVHVNRVRTRPTKSRGYYW